MADVDVMAIKLNTTLANKMIEGTENDGYNK